MDNRWVQSVEIIQSMSDVAELHTKLSDVEFVKCNTDELTNDTRLASGLRSRNWMIVPFSIQGEIKQSREQFSFS